MNEMKATVFEKLCEQVQNWHSSVATAREIVRSLAHEGRNVSLYKVRKALKELKSDGYVEKRSEECPPRYSYEGECLDEGRPPRNGWAITEKGRETETYRKAEAKYMQGLADWANGKFDGEDNKMNYVTDNPDTNVSSALNLFYVRNGEAYVRGYGENGEDISLIDFVKRIAIIQAIPILYEISEYLTDCLFDNEPESEEGLLALFYTAGWAFAEIRERLKEYEESGLEPEEVLMLKKELEDTKKDVEN